MGILFTFTASSFFVWFDKRHFFFFTNVNPGIDSFGGFFFDSKDVIDRKIPAIYRPKSFLVKPFESADKLEAFLSTLDLSFPVIIKPDAGERGKGVVKIYTKLELRLHLAEIKALYLVQEYVTHQLEYGVFVSYIPNEGKYKLISLTEKRFFTVVGDGESTINTLIKFNPEDLFFIAK